MFDRKLEDLILKNWAKDYLRFVHHISQTDFSYQYSSLSFTVILRSQQSVEVANSHTFKTDNQQTLDFFKDQIESLRKNKSKSK